VRLYSGHSKQFLEDTYQNQIAEKLKNSFFDHYGFNPSISEINSWRNSLRAISIVFQNANLLDHGIILEYQLPLSSRRLDCLICGKDDKRTDNAVIVELKQWDKCEYAVGDNEVLTWVGGAKREILHPSVQVGQYKLYLEDTHTAFYESDQPVRLHACSYLHNYNYYSDDVLFAPKFERQLTDSPLFTADDVPKLSAYLQGKLARGDGLDILGKIEKSKYRPSKKLMNHVGTIIKGRSEYILLDEQLVVYDKVFSCAKNGFHDKQKSVIVIKGGPGTGKSVIAINLMADLLKQEYNAHYATGSKAFTETLRKIIGTRGSAQFKYFNSYIEAEANDIDVLVADESHRIRETSNSRFTPRTRRSDLSQLEELLHASKVLVCFIDDQQVVRPNEIGSSHYVKAFALKNKCKYFEYELEAQFRCAGSDAFVNWINNTLGIRRTANVIWNTNEEFDFKIFNSPSELEKAIRQKVTDGFTGRVTAGFCWPWSMPNQDGTLKDDVVIGDYKRPWDAKPEAKKLAPGIPKASLWAYDPNGLEQVGCVYTAQGFEFDYVGVIFGKDLIYDPETAEWKGIKENNADSVVKRSKDKFVDLVKNTYRVLLSRGMKGCYVYFMDKNTENFFRSRMEKRVEPHLVSVKKEESDLFLSDIVSGDALSEGEKFVEYLPVYSLEAAASGFGREDYVEEIGWKRVDSGIPLSKEMFIVKVVGKSMEPTIKDGTYCVFRKEKGGSRTGVVLVESKEVVDADNNAKYTVKKYQSEKELFDDGTWNHKRIVLSPANSQFKEIVLENVNPGDFRVVAEFVRAL